MIPSTTYLARLSLVALLLVILGLLGWVVLDLAREPIYQSPWGAMTAQSPQPPFEGAHP